MTPTRRDVLHLSLAALATSGTRAYGLAGCGLAAPDARELFDAIVNGEGK